MKLLILVLHGAVNALSTSNPLTSSTVPPPAGTQQVSQLREGNATDAAPEASQGAKGPECRKEWIDVNEGSRTHGYKALDDSELQKALGVSSMGDFDAAVQKLTKPEKTFTIWVFGGSVTTGHFCGRPDDTQKIDKDCAWPSNVDRWLQKQYPNGKIQVRNLARPGTNTAAMLGEIGIILSLDPLPDLLIWDYSVNDAAWAAAPGQGDRRTVMAYESFLRLITGNYPSVQVATFWSCKVRHKGAMRFVHILIRAGDKCKILREKYVETSAYYGVPFIDHGQLISNQVWRIPENDQHGLHPDWMSHQYMADTFIYAMKQALGPSCSGGLTERSTLTTDRAALYRDTDRLYPTCSKPESMYTTHAEFAAKSGSPVDVNGWAIEEDVAGKPGWIATKAGSEITFPLKFGTPGIFFVTYLKSFSNIGKISLSMNDVTYELDAKWNAPNSQEETTFFNAYLPHHVGLSNLFKYHQLAIGYGLKKPYGNLTIKLLDTKFKITNLGSC